MHAQREGFRLIVHIRKVWLAVRFNCKLAFMLKNELSEKLAESDSSFDLLRGECSVNQTLSLEVPANALLTRCKKLRLIVMMISANGMVPAGYVTFSPHPRATYEQFELILPLERCEDAKAQIKFLHVLEECSKTPRENSYIQQLAFKSEGNFSNGYNLQESPSKRLIASPSRQRLSLHKQRRSEVLAFTPVQYNRQERYSKLDNNSRLVPRKSQANHMQKLNLDSDIRFQETVQDIKIKQNDQSDFGLQHHMTRDQLIKEHQEYWMEIIRMEEENEGLKQENERLKLQEAHLKKQYQKIKEDYQADEEKIHAFVSQNQQNSETIRQLQVKIQEQKITIQQKDEFEKDYYKLVQILQEQLNSQKTNSEQTSSQLSAQIAQLQDNHKQEVAKMQEQIKKLEEAFQQSIRREQNIKQQYEKFKEEQDTASLKKNCIDLQQKQQQLQVAQETVLFLQSQIKKYELLNLQLEETNSHQTENMNVLQAINQDLNLKNAQLTQIYEQKRHQAELFQQAVEQMDRRLNSEETAKKNLDQSLSFQKRHNKELELIIEQHGEEIEHLKSKLNNRDRDLEIERKNNSQKTEDISNYSRQIQHIREEHEMFELKLLQNEAIIASKNTKIKELSQINEQLMTSNRQMSEKITSLENEFSLLSQYLNKEQSQKNKLANMLSNIQDNGRTYEQECKRLKKRKDELKKHISVLDNEVKSLQQQNDQREAVFVKAMADFKQHKDNIEGRCEEASNKITSLSTSLVTALSQLEQERSRYANKDEQYQSSYNNNITSLTLKLSKLEKQNIQFNRKIELLETERNDFLSKLQEKQNQITQLKTFTRDKLQDNLKLMKQSQQIKKKLAELEENSTKIESSFIQEVSIGSNSKIEQDPNEPSGITVSEESMKSDSKAEAKKKKKKR